jgi:hypothetical protein
VTERLTLWRMEVKSSLRINSDGTPESILSRFSAESGELDLVRLFDGDTKGNTGALARSEVEGSSCLISTSA